MQATRTTARTKAIWTWIVVGCGLAALVANASGRLPDAMALLMASGSDDIMRFLSVRDWLAGQGWFDMRQAGVVAEGGLTLHWSRLVDVGIAAIILPLGAIWPGIDAEAAAIVWWPVVLHCLLVVVTARAALRHFGAGVAAIAVLWLVIWPLLIQGYLEPGRLDHHGVQILLLALIVFSLLADPGDRVAAIRAGLLTALSLAVGLETLLALGLVGVVFGWRAVREPGVAGGALGAYALTLGLGSVAAFAAQTAPSAWLDPHCDQLGPPLLTALGAASAAALGLSAILPRIASFPLRIGVASAALGGAAVVAAPALLGCLGGPYGDLPNGLEAEIHGTITEAMSVLALWHLQPRLVHFNVVPLLAAVAIATVFWIRDADVSRRRAAGTLLAFGWLGVFATLFQIRMIVIGAAVSPLLVGYALIRVFEWRRAEARSARSSLAFLASIGLTVMYPYGYLVTKHLVLPKSATASNFKLTSVECRALPILETLRGLPEGRVLSSLNLGPPILLASGLPVLAAPYHRSAAALTNGIVPFRMDEAAFRAFLNDAGADYVVLCRNEAHPGFAGDLAQGVPASGLRLVPDVAPELVVYEVVR